ncbi:MAG: hypothetical protein Q9160_004028 [Pyrenula sp. 1 TL-2023]
MPTLSSRRNRASQRQSETPRASTARPSTPQSITTLPPYESPTAPLNAKAQIALSGLLGNPAVTKLQKQIADAASLLHTVASDLNDYGAECRELHLKKKARRGGNEEDPTAEAEHAETEKRVEELTTKLDHAVRKAVDEEVLVGALPEIMEGVVNQASESERTAQTQSSFPTQTQRSRNRRTMADDDSEDEDEGNDEAQNASGQREATSQPIVSASTVLSSALQAHNTSRASQSLSNRYANHNTYIAFKQSVHDAQHHEENAPPLPSRKTWFAAEDQKRTAPTDEDSPSSSNRRDTTIRHPRPTTSANPATQQEQSEEEEDDDELEVRSEKISTKCPITFLPFQSPLTSTKCRHSFEAHAILDMLSRSKDSLPVGPPPSSSQAPSQSQARHRSGFVKAVKCPICSTLNSREDLREDHVLARKVRRLEALETQRMERMEEDEEDEEEEDDGDRRQVKKEKEKGVVVGSSPPKSLKERVKNEQASGRSMMAQVDGVAESGEQEPPPGTAATVVDLESDEDEDEEDDDDDDDETGRMDGEDGEDDDDVEMSE